MKRLIAALACGLLLSFGAMGMAAAQDPLNQVCDPLTGTADSPTCQSRTKNNPLTGTNGLLESIANVVALVAGIAAVIMILIGGFRYITANGDSQAAITARKTVMAAIIGLVVIVAARSLIVFVLRRLT